MVKFSIVTDRTQNYDRYLVDREPDYIWYRDSNDRIMDRAAAFTIFDRIGLTPPPHAWAAVVNKSAAIDLGRYHPTIVYLDPCTHNGAGKIFLQPGRIGEFIDRLGWGDRLLCSRFIPTTSDGKSVSHTYLRIADREYWLESTGSDWRSNYSFDSKWREIDLPDWLTPAAEILAKKTKLRYYPVLSVDFIRDLAGNVYAIDLNTAPVVEEYGLNLDPETLARELRGYIVEHLDTTPDYCLKATSIPLDRTSRILERPIGLMHIPFGAILSCHQTQERFEHIENPEYPTLAFRCIHVPHGTRIEVEDRLELEIPLKLGDTELKASPIAKLGETVEYADLFTQREIENRQVVSDRTWKY